MSRVSDEYLEELASRRTWKWMEIAPEILMARELRLQRKVTEATITRMNRPHDSDALWGLQQALAELDALGDEE